MVLKVKTEQRMLKTAAENDELVKRLEAKGDDEKDEVRKKIRSDE
jgi:hypothetical protein